MDQVRIHPDRSLDSIKHPNQNSTIGYESRMHDGSMPMPLSQEQPEDCCIRLLEKYTALVNSYEFNADPDPELLKN